MVRDAFVRSFDTLYEFAERLILDDKCYVCHQTGDEIKACRELRQHHKPGYESPYRNRPVEESLKLFRDMRDGKFKEGEASLRMKIDWEHPNPCMWDPVAYRIKHMPHPTPATNGAYTHLTITRTAS